ncbi:hypothetical protein D1839_14650 [Roseburia sp. 1XD42-34]|nr:hypothetical protein [Roseburia sp. 1XD42-34]RKI76817.1 hypothetical protein D7V87_12310 [Clostridium sp. 1xD42-85]
MLLSPTSTASARIFHLEVGGYNTFLQGKGIMPLKQGYTKVWMASPFLVGLPLCDEPMRPYGRTI